MINSPTNLDFKDAKRDPSKFFEMPAEIAATPAFSTVQKLEILRSWEADAKLLQRAEAENMAGGEPSRLEEIVEAIQIVQATQKLR